jgi:hypothetical protein
MGNTNNIPNSDDDSSVYLYIILGFLFLVALSSGGSWYNNNYSDADVLAKSADVSDKNANNSAQLAVSAASSSNSTLANKSANDAVTAAALTNLLTDKAKKALAANDLAAAKKLTDDANKTKDAAKAALVKTLNACENKLNIFTGTDGKNYICPPMYSFGNKNTNNYGDGFKFAETNANKCWIVHDSKKDCGWGSCDPSLYSTSNGKKIALKEVTYGTPEMDIAGNYINVSTLWTPNGSAYFINNPMKYSDTEYCPA